MIVSLRERFGAISFSILQFQFLNVLFFDGTHAVGKIYIFSVSFRFFFHGNFTLTTSSQVECWSVGKSIVEFAIRGENANSVCIFHVCFRQPVLPLIKWDSLPFCATLQALIAVVSVNKWFQHPWGRVTHYAWHSRAVELCVETPQTPPVQSKYSELLLRDWLALNLRGLLHRGPWGSGDLSSAHFSRVAGLRWVMSRQIRRSATLCLRIKCRFQVVWVRHAFKLGRRCVSQGEETPAWYDCWAPV